MGVLKILAGICILVSIGISLFFLDRYVEKIVSSSQKTGVLELINTPPWVNDELKQKIYAAATANGEDLKLADENARGLEAALRAVVWKAEEFWDDKLS